MENMNDRPDRITLPCGCFCDDGKCGDCVYLDYSRQGTSDRNLFLCRRLDKYRYPWDTSKYECSGFVRR